MTRFFMTAFLAVTNVLCAMAGWTVGTHTVCGEPDYCGVALANGVIGVVPGGDGLFSIRETVLNGVYAGLPGSGITRIVSGPVPVNPVVRAGGKEVFSAEGLEMEETLDMRRAVLTREAVSGGLEARWSLCALRQLPYGVLGVLELRALEDVSVEVSNMISLPGQLEADTEGKYVLRDDDISVPVSTVLSHTACGSHYIAASACMTGPDGKAADSLCLSLERGETVRLGFIGTICTSRDFADPFGESQRMVMYAAVCGTDDLVSAHGKKWEELWNGDIIIGGNIQDQRDVRLALYNLYSFQTEGTGLSIPPMGLSSSAGYNGHIFWDSEIWMYPPVLVLDPSLASGHLDYRYARLDAAMKRAVAYGYKGAMFPWESDDSGDEMTPVWCLTGTFEHHVTADVAIAFWNYYRVTGDREWLASKGWPVLKAVADFWVSRAEKRNDGKWSVRNVVGADEYARNVDDNAFTNGAARVALEAAVSAATILGKEYPEEWSDAGGNMLFHYLPDGTMAEYEGYDGRMIKQADVNLLAYPLGLVTSPEDVRRDLEYYQGRIDPVNGPAMGNSILSILYCRLGETEKAYEYFRKSFVPHKRGGFGVLSESPSSDNPYFATGAGGLLQAVLFGFAGLEITDSGLVVSGGALPESWDSLTVVSGGKVLVSLVK